MRVLSWPRRAGKTTEVLNWWRADPYNRVVITAYEDEAERLRGLVGEDYREFAATNIRAYRAGGLIGVPDRATVVIDNVDLLLDRLIGHHVAGITLTEP